MTIANVEVFDPRYFANYPRQNVIIGGVLGYFTHFHIPFYFEINSNTDETKQLWFSGFRWGWVRTRPRYVSGGGRSWCTQKPYV